jgi:hypothetical protein
MPGWRGMSVRGLDCVSKNGLAEGCMPLCMTSLPVAHNELVKSVIQENGHGLSGLLTDLMQRTDAPAVDAGLVQLLVAIPVHPFGGHMQHCTMLAAGLAGG